MTSPSLDEFRESIPDPPTDANAEMAVLGISLKDMYPKNLPALPTGAFTGDKRPFLWDAITSIAAAGHPVINQVLVGGYVRTNGLLPAGPSLRNLELFMAECVSTAPGAVALDYYVEQAREALTRRTAIAVANKVIIAAHVGSTDDLRTIIQQGLRQVATVDRRAVTRG